MNEEQKKQPSDLDKFLDDCDLELARLENSNRRMKNLTIKLKGSGEEVVGVADSEPGALTLIERLEKFNDDFSRANNDHEERCVELEAFI